MSPARRFQAIGLMSGTSMDGIDAAVIDTDGEGFLSFGPQVGVPYPPELRGALLRLRLPGPAATDIERDVTDLQSQAVLDLCDRHDIDLSSIDVIGFHGQTIVHAPHERRTWQLGNGQQMANALRRPVVNRFRQTDLENGGQGAPLAPAFHRALVYSSGLSLPVAVLNIGGVSNLSLVDEGFLYACDCGPGNALIDDWVYARFGLPFDDEGRIAAAGRVNQEALHRMLDHEYFARPGPKSLDRNTFSVAPVSDLSPQDGAATLTAFTAAAIAATAQRMPAQPKEWIVVGGGRLNQRLLLELRKKLSVPVRVAEDVGWSGDAVEAQAFGYLAVRTLLNLPISWPSTTGVSKPMCGGVVWRPSAVR